VKANRSEQRFVTEMPPPDDVQWISDLDDEIEVLYDAAMPRHMQVRRRHLRASNVTMATRPAEIVVAPHVTWSRTAVLAATSAVGMAAIQLAKRRREGAGDGVE
jgi:hypothetical protein